MSQKIVIDHDAIAAELFDQYMAEVEETIPQAVVAQLLQVSETTVFNWVHAKKPGFPVPFLAPSPAYPNRMRRVWKTSQILAWIAENKPELTEAGQTYTPELNGFLTGQFAPEQQKLQHFSKRQLARQNRAKTTTVHLRGDW